MSSRFETLFAGYGGMIARIAASYEADRHKRDDLVQDIALALWRSRDRIEQAENEKAYVARIAQNVAITHVARAVKAPKTTEPSSEIKDDRPTIDHQLAEEQQRQQLLEAVRSLPLSLRSVVTMALEGLSHRDIGEALNLTENNVGVRFARAKAHLKKVLASPTGNAAEASET